MGRTRPRLRWVLLRVLADCPSPGRWQGQLPPSQQPEIQTIVESCKKLSWTVRKVGNRLLCHTPTEVCLQRCGGDGGAGGDDGTQCHPSSFKS
ncbi:uncharacterized protein UV8b_03476 [Ustilaginoidea virens]|uniref:Uncharacterized protein n=1 Tax=Ustilaginoidea virens TaxID=1159556 RepID=A0A8E5HPF7_USTVR|nr:uncharacterized protein UV8b_03476 [Ustilaginoidea virens]QUC19235.1 hypothetical protein UV8b_03476 [Ustilaginoidea virens]